MRRVYIIGSINTDLVIGAQRLPRMGETVHGTDFFINAGGKGANQAVAAAKLGADVRFCARVGADLFGRDLRAGLERQGVDTRFVREAAGCSSGVALITVVDGNNCIVLSAGANAALGKDAAAECLAEAEKRGHSPLADGDLARNGALCVAGGEEARHDRAAQPRARRERDGRTHPRLRRAHPERDGGNAAGGGERRRRGGGKTFAALPARHRDGGGARLPARGERQGDALFLPEGANGGYDRRGGIPSAVRWRCGLRGAMR